MVVIVIVILVYGAGVISAILICIKVSEEHVDERHWGEIIIDATFGVIGWALFVAHEERVPLLARTESEQYSLAG